MQDERLHVVEFADGVAGPVCGRLFAALGHEVVKVERPDGDVQRAVPPFFAAGPRSSVSFAYHALGKRICTLDPESDEGRAHLERLLDGADVLVHGLLPADADRLGLSADRLRATHPGVVVVAVTAFGSTGANSTVPGDSLLAEAFGGLVSMVGEPGRAPLSLGGRQAEYSAGVAAFLGACVALASPGTATPSVDVAAADVAAYFDWKSETTVRAGGTPPRRTGRGGRWKLFDARDGQIGLIYQPHQWALVADVIPVPALRDERFETQAGRDRHDAEWSALVAEWLAGQSAVEVARRGQEVGLPLEALSGIADVARSAQFAARGFLRDVEIPGVGTAVFPASPAPALPWDMSAPTALSGEDDWPRPTHRRPWWRRGTAAKPLSGITVLDMGQITAGAALSRLLADFGARVIKIESPRQPDPMRVWGAVSPEPTDVSPLFAPNNVGKEAVALDLKSDRGRALFLRLAAQCDVVVENFAAGVTDRLGVGFDDVLAVNDRVVYASLSGHGQHGPDARHKSYGSTLDLVSGAASITGYPGHPIWSSFDLNYPDQLVSLHGAALVVHSILTRRRGVHLDVSQAEVVSSTIGDLIAAYFDSGAEPAPTGNARDDAAPHDVYPCRGDDEWLAVSVRTDAERHALAAVVNAADDSADALDAAVRSWAAGRDKRAAADALVAAGVPAVPVLTAVERHVEPRFRDRGVFAPVGDPGVKGLPFVIVPPLAGAPAPAPGLGSDSARILAELCDVTPTDYDALADDGVVPPRERKETR